MNSNELFVPNNLLETCQGLQEAIAMQPADSQDDAGHEAQRIIGSHPEFHGATKLEVRSSCSFALPDGLTFESEIWPVVRFGELRLNGHLANVSYLRMGGIRTLAWMLVNPKIRQVISNSNAVPVSSEQELAVCRNGDTLRRPLYLPVGFIESVLVAS